MCDISVRQGCSGAGKDSLLTEKQLKCTFFSNKVMLDANTSYLKLLLLTFASQQKHVIALFDTCSVSACLLCQLFQNTLLLPPKIIFYSFVESKSSTSFGDMSPKHSRKHYTLHFHGSKYLPARWRFQFFCTKRLINSFIR